MLPSSALCHRSRLHLRSRLVSNGIVCHPFRLRPGDEADADAASGRSKGVNCHRRCSRSSCCSSSHRLLPSSCNGRQCSGDEVPGDDCGGGSPLHATRGLRQRWQHRRRRFDGGALFLLDGWPNAQWKESTAAQQKMTMTTTTTARKGRIRREWHDPSFMQESTPHDKEAWLESLLSSSSRAGARARGLAVVNNDNAGVDRQRHAGAGLAANGIDVEIAEEGAEEVDAKAYFVVLNGWAKSGAPDAPFRTEHWIGRLERHYHHRLATTVAAARGANPASDPAPVSAPTSTFASFTAARAMEKRKDNSFKAADADVAEVDDLAPTTGCYNAVIEAWSNSTEITSAIRAERWFNKMRKRSTGIDDGEDSNRGNLAPSVLSPPEPDTESYNLYLNALSKGHGKTPDVLKANALKGEEMLREMISLSKDEGEGGGGKGRVRPTTDSVHYVMRALTRCRRDNDTVDNTVDDDNDSNDDGQPILAERVMKWVRTMEQYHRDDVARRLNEKGVQYLFNNDDGDRVRPDTRTYCMAMDAWSVAAGIKATKFANLKRARRHNKQLQRRRRHAQGGRPHGDYGKEHEVHNSHIDDHYTENDGDDDGTKEVEKAASILRYMHELHDMGYAHVSPTTVAYNTLLSAWSRVASEYGRPDVPLHAERVLRRMIELRDEEGFVEGAPDVISYNTVIKAWSRTKRPNSGHRAVWWLRKMWDDFRIYDDTENLARQSPAPPIPNAETYNRTMEAWCNLNDAVQAEDLLLEMLELEERKDVSICPNTESFSLVIRAWLKEEAAKDGEADLFPGRGLENAWRWLRELLQREASEVPGATAPPDLFVSILKAAKKSASTEDHVFSVALKTFSAFRDSRHHVDAQSYSWLLETGLRVLSRPVDDKRRTKFITRLTKQCCDDGLLSSSFVKVLANGPVFRNGWTIKESKRLTIRSLGGWPYPKNWSRNIRKEAFVPKESDAERKSLQVQGRQQISW